MMEINKKSARMLSMIGQRGAVFGIGMLKAAERYDDLMLTVSDPFLTYGLAKFKAKYPEKTIDVGIAEQNLIGISAGLAKEGNMVFPTTYATFLTMRAFEQIRHNLGYMKLPIKLIGVSAGYVADIMGSTHYAIEDISLMRSIPNVKIVCPADAVESYKMLFELAKTPGPFYMRLSGSVNMPIVYEEDYELEIGRGCILKKGSQVAIIAHGLMVHESLKAEKLLAKKNISTTVINMHTIKPVDTDLLSKVFNEHELVITVEEHNVIGGLSSAVAEYKAGIKDTPPMVIKGVPDIFTKPASQKYLFDKFGLTGEKLAADIYKDLKNYPPPPPSDKARLFFRNWVLLDTFLALEIERLKVRTKIIWKQSLKIKY